MSERTSAYTWTYKRLIKDTLCYETFRTVFAVAVCACSVFAVRYIWLLVLMFACWKLVQRLRQAMYKGFICCQDYAVFITGCDTGFGHAIARHLDSLGFTVFAGCYRPGGHGARILKAHCSRRLHVVPLDVTNDDSVRKAFDYVQSNLKGNGLWGVVNNAGLDFFGEVELTPVHMVHGLMNVNLYGAIRVTNMFLPLLRATRGRYVAISSVNGQLYAPAISPYTASKHGLETLMDSLRLEMSKFGVAVSIVEPGFFGHATSIIDEENVKRVTDEIETMWSLSTQEQQQTYGKNHMLSWIPCPMGGRYATGSSQPVLQAVAHALTSDMPETRYLIGGTYRWLYDEYAILTTVLPLLPTWISDWFWVRWTECDYLHRDTKTT